MIKNYPRLAGVWRNPAMIAAILLFLCHVPFLRSDPDTLVDINTRGAWTDEGLYSSQVRNLVDHGRLDLQENTTLVRGPLFNLIQLPFYLAFGTGLPISRLIVLALVACTLLMIACEKELKWLSLFLVMIVFTQFHIFQFSHYNMAEMESISFILLAMLWLAKYARRKPGKGGTKWIFLSALFLFFSYLSKVQYLYAAAILPMTLFFTGVGDFFSGRGLKALKPFIISVLITFLFALLWFLIWYLPQKGFFNYVMYHETQARFPHTLKEFLEITRFHFFYNLWTREMKYLVLLFLISIPAWIYLKLKKRVDGVTGIVIVFTLSWILLELHKLPMTYLPTRYLLSLEMASGVFACAVLAIFFRWRNALAYVIFAAAILLMVRNLDMDREAWARRSHDLEKVNSYLARYDFSQHPVAGCWAASCCWKSKAITYPVWNNYLNDNVLGRKDRPRALLAEFNESDSDNAFASKNIDLKAVSDSSRTFSIWRYEVVVYWLKPVQ